MIVPHFIGHLVHFQKKPINFSPVYNRCMPTVLRFDGLRVVIYPNDHRPAHVHIISAEGEAVFVLNCPDGPPELREHHGASL